MKIRKGFVSNSSTSSFCLIVKKSDYDSVVEGLTALEKDVINFVKDKTVQAFGTELNIISYVSGNYSTLEDYSYDGEKNEIEEKMMEEYGPFEILEDIISKLEKFDHVNVNVDM